MRQFLLFLEFNNQYSLLRVKIREVPFCTLFFALASSKNYFWHIENEKWAHYHEACTILNFVSDDLIYPKLIYLKYCSLENNLNFLPVVGIISFFHIKELLQSKITYFY
jgi:hypothetical protein